MLGALRERYDRTDAEVRSVIDSNCGDDDNDDVERQSRKFSDWQSRATFQSVCAHGAAPGATREETDAVKAGDCVSAENNFYVK